MNHGPLLMKGVARAERRLGVFSVFILYCVYLWGCQDVRMSQNFLPLLLVFILLMQPLQILDPGSICTSAESVVLIISSHNLSKFWTQVQFALALALVLN